MAALAVAGLGTFAVASPAAADDSPHYASGEWQLRDWEGPYPDVEASPAKLSEASCDEVVLAKPDVASGGTALYGATSDGDIGTSYENTDLALPVQPGDVLVVEYFLSDTANAAAGAVRMFVYDTANADTLNTAPTFPGFTPPARSEAIADPVSPGMLNIAFSTAGTIRTFGLTYDASNDTEGTVTFTQLNLVNVDKQTSLPISFCAKPAPPGTTTTTTTTSGALANTGTSLTTVLVVAAVLFVGGAAIVVLARRRRT